VADFVFAHLGIRSCKDKVMEEPGTRNGAVPWLAMRAVIVAYWREVDSQSPLSPAALSGSGFYWFGSSKVFGVAEARNVMACPASGLAAPVGRFDSGWRVRDRGT
jgi:hypothetical protein